NMSYMINLDRLIIRYIDKYNNVSSAPILNTTYGSETSATVELNITEDANAYGLEIDIWGTNSSAVCNGTIDVNYTETNNHYVKANMSKLDIRVYDLEGNWDAAYGNVFVEVENGTTGDLITTLLTTDEGIAKGQKNPDLDFWYLNYNISSNIPQLYNFTLHYAGSQRNFNVSSDQYTTPAGKYLNHFNYSLIRNTTIEFKIQLNIANFSTRFQNDTVIGGNTKEWRQNFTFRAKFMSTENKLDTPPSWSPVTSPDYVIWEIQDSLADVTFFSGIMNQEADGYYNYTFDSTSLVGGENYFFIVYAFF
ncbi:hypothetical protein LCGC14_3113740, partial [marine sediment metagenome]